MLVANKPFPSFDINNVTLPNQISPDTIFSILMEKDMKENLKRFNNSECISKYSSTFETNYASLLLVSDDYNSKFDAKPRRCGSPVSVPNGRFVSYRT